MRSQSRAAPALPPAALTAPSQGSGTRQVADLLARQSKQLARQSKQMAQQSKQLGDVLETQRLHSDLLTRQSEQLGDVLKTQRLHSDLLARHSDLLARQSEQLGEMLAAQTSLAANVGALVDVAAADATAPRGSPHRPRSVSTERLHELVALLRPVLSAGDGNDADAVAQHCVSTLCNDLADADVVRPAPLLRSAP